MRSVSATIRRGSPKVNCLEPIAGRVAGLPVSSGEGGSLGASGPDRDRARSTDCRLRRERRRCGPPGLRGRGVSGRNGEFERSSGLWCVGGTGLPLCSRDRGLGGPYTLVTVEEVERIVGTLKQPGAGGRERAVRWCSFEFVDEQSALEVYVWPADGLALAKRAARKPVGVSGFGPDAVLDRNMQLGYVELYVIKGDVTLEVALKDSSAPQDTIQGPVRKALARL